VSDTVLRGKRSESFEVILIETHRDLFRARATNDDVEIFKISCELLHAVT
jgi:hypothetical protein